MPGHPVVIRYRRRRRRRAGTGEYETDRGQETARDGGVEDWCHSVVCARVPLPGPEGIRDPGSRVPLFSLFFPVVTSGQVNSIVGGDGQN